MIFDSALASSRYDRHSRKPRIYRLFDAVLQKGFSQNREHLFGDRFGCGQKARAVSRGGKQTFFYHYSSSTLFTIKVVIVAISLHFYNLYPIL
jgi:hypothetical protein